MPGPTSDDSFATARARMVDDQLRARGIADDRVLRAMSAVERHRFVPDALAANAYDDRPLPIGSGATISQPFIVALMTQGLAVGPDDRVLEVGTGSGFGAAVLAECASHVTTVESVAALVATARRVLAPYGDRIEVIEADGSVGHAAGAPYDAISVTAAAPEIPPPLLDQLAPGGRLVMPAGRAGEELVLVERTPDGDRRSVLCRVRFVPLTGRHGA